MRIGIRQQLLIPLLAVLLGVAGMTAWGAWSAAARERMRIERSLRGIAETLSKTRFPINRQTLELMKGLSGADFLVAEADGTPVPVLATLRVPADTEFRRLDESFHERALGEAGLRLELATPLEPTRGRNLFLLYPESALAEARREAVRPALIVGLLVGGFALALSLMTTSLVARRVKRLSRRTKAIAAGDFHVMTLGGPLDELRDLGDSIDEMARRLEAAQDSLKQGERLRLLGQVGGGLAHQLRNAAAGARLAVQLHAEDCGNDREPLDVAIRQLDRIEANLKRFLHLGQSHRPAFRRIDLAGLVSESVALAGPRCRHTNIELVWKPSDPMTANLDAELLKDCLDNLIENALDAAGPGGRVEIRLEGDGGSIILQVRDSGPGPTPEVADRVFEPFATGKPEGVGLGLTVARDAVAASGGTLAWRRDAGETVFEIRLKGSTEA